MPETLMTRLLYFLIGLALAGAVVTASAEGTVVDPTITPTLTITCIDPVEREDGTPLAIGEIATRNFFVSATAPGAAKNWTPAGSNNTACRQVYDLGAVIDGQYYYTATAVDTDGRESAFAPGVVALEVKRLAPPKPPNGLSGSAQ